MEWADWGGWPPLLGLAAGRFWVTASGSSASGGRGAEGRLPAHLLQRGEGDPIIAHAGSFRPEGMPLESLQQGVPWNWTSFGEWLGQLEGTLSINTGFATNRAPT